MKKLSILLAAALVTAAGISRGWQPVSFEERAIQLQLDQAPPELAKALEDEPIEVKAVVLDYMDNPLLLVKAQAALMRYPQFAREILPLYGDTPEFREILLAYGDSVLPPIHYFLNNEVKTVSMMHYAGQKMQAIKTSAKRFWHSEKEAAHGEAAQAADHVQKTQLPPQQAPDTANQLTPEQRGWYAVNFIRNEGHDFLGQFVMDSEGNPKWIQSERVLEGASWLFTTGIRDLETKIQTDQALTAGDFGWAAVDAFVMVGAVKLLRIGRAAAASGETVSATTRTAALTSRLARASQLGLRIAKYGKWPALAVAAYIAIRHPSIISDALADIANFLGMPTWLGLFTGWALILLPALYIGSWLVRLIVRPTIALLRSILSLLAWMEGTNGKKIYRSARDRSSSPMQAGRSLA